MPDWNYTGGQAISGATTGAEVGTAFGGPLGTAIGAGAGFVVGGLEGLFGESPEQQRKRRYAALLAQLEQNRRALLGEGQTLIGQQTSDQVALARAAGARRAAASGRYADVSAFTAPEVGRVEDLGSNRLNQYALGVNRQVAGAEMSAAEQFAGRPIEPSIGDYLMTAGEAASQYGAQRQQQKIQEGTLGAIQNYIKTIGGLQNNSFGYTRPAPAPSTSDVYSAPSGFGEAPSSWMRTPPSSRRYSVGRLPALSMGGNY